uniref:Peptidase S1 domain-containing protein n=1 Tax=Xenopus tropicalis TaxID=8364 RepID=A0A6I8SH77_XENTR
VDLVTVCGQRLVSSRIVGGVNSRPGMWPWQVYLRGPNFFCGGSLITSKWIISAAHCCHRSVVYEMAGQIFPQSIWRRSPNPDYSTIGSGTFSGSDICLMELQTELNFTQYISPVCLPASGVAFPTGLPCWVTGWGNIVGRANLPPPKTLQEVLVPLIGAQVCKSYYSRVANITDNMICAGYVSGGKGICQGDSGGPLVCAQADRWYLVGIVSFGIPCEQKYYPSVYGRSNAFVDWITTLVPEVSPNVLNVNFTGTLISIYNVTSTTEATTLFLNS